MKYHATLAALTLPMMSCLSQAAPESAQGFAGAGFGSVKDSFGLQFQDGFYQAEPMLGSNSIGLYGGVGLSNLGLIGETEDDFYGGSGAVIRVDEEIGALWASLGATYRVTGSIGLRVGITAASITTYGVYEDYFFIDEVIVEEESESSFGGELGVDYIPDGDSGSNVGVGAIYSSALDAWMINLFVIQ